MIIAIHTGLPQLLAYKPKSLKTGIIVFVLSQISWIIIIKFYKNDKN